MRYSILAILVLLSPGFTDTQVLDTFLLKYAVSKYDTITYKRIIQFDKRENLYYVRDFFEKGKIQMDAHFSSFDKTIKEEYQCNYLTNTKEGSYQEWYDNGQIKFMGFFRHGKMNGHCLSWYKNGQAEADENWLNGQLHGRTKYWTEHGDLQFDLVFKHGMNRKPKEVSYPYLSYLPKDYHSDTLKRWPLIIYLHGGSGRGTDLKKIYASGIPDQIYRGREFPFIVISPQCPEHIRWSTDHWFENFLREISARYRIDTTRIYLTGASLGGSGTWYLAIKYSGIFAAIAPMCGFTSHMDYIDKNIDSLDNIPIWAFHGKIDNVVPFEETERMIKKLEGKNKNLKFTVEPDVGHGVHWLVYPEDELYDWFLQYKRKSD